MSEAKQQDSTRPFILKITEARDLEQLKTVQLLIHTALAELRRTQEGSSKQLSMKERIENTVHYLETRLEFTEAQMNGINYHGNRDRGLEPRYSTLAQRILDESFSSLAASSTAEGRAWAMLSRHLDWCEKERVAYMEKADSLRAQLNDVNRMARIYALQAESLHTALHSKPALVAVDQVMPDK